MDFRNFRNIVREKALTGTGLAKRFFKWLDELTSDYRNVQSLGLWIAAVGTGLLAVSYAKAFRFVELSYESLLSNEVAIAVALTPLCFLLAWWLVYRYAPEASGSGIPQIMAAIDTEYPGPHSKFVDRLLSVRTAAIKIVSSLLCLAGGGAIGREGPTLQISGAIFHFFGKQVRRYYPNSDEQTWVIAGAAAGLASAFNTPLGGIVYAIEELGMKHFHKIRTALLTAVIISGLVAQGLMGSYLYLGYPVLQPFSGAQWGLVVLTAFAAGLAGSLFNRVLLSLSRRRRAIKSKVRLALVTVGCGCAAATLIYFIPGSSGPGSNLITGILFKGETASWSLSASRMVATAAAYLSGAAGGIFSPSLTIGACIGSKIAYLFGSANVNLLAMLGMISFLTGVTHTPFTSFILVMEMSDRHSAVFPMMVAALIANSVAKSIQKKSFYESVRDDLLAART